MARGNGADGVALPDDAAAQVVSEGGELVGLALNHALHGDAGPRRDDSLHVSLGDLRERRILCVLGAPQGLLEHGLALQEQRGLLVEPLADGVALGLEDLLELLDLAVEALPLGGSRRLGTRRRPRSRSQTCG